MRNIQVEASNFTRAGTTCKPAMGFAFAAGTTDGESAAGHPARSSIFCFSTCYEALYWTSPPSLNVKEQHAAPIVPPLPPSVPPYTHTTHSPCHLLPPYRQPPPPPAPTTPVPAGPGAFDFQQSDTNGTAFWRLVRNFIRRPTPEQEACHKPKPILLDVGEYWRGAQGCKPGSRALAADAVP